MDSLKSQFNTRKHGTSSRWGHFFGRVLVTIVVTEFLVMFLLPLFLPANVNTWVEALCDAMLLAILSTPVLWMFVFQPLRQLAVREKSRADIIIDTAVNPIITISNLGIIKSFNPAAERLFGYSASEALGMNAILLMPASFQGQHGPHLVNLLNAGRKNFKGIEREVTGQHKDGTVFPISLSIGELVYENNEILFTGIIRDLTAQKQMDAELIRTKKSAEAANQSKSEFLANMSHEIRTPMTAILGFTDLLFSEGDISKAPKHRLDSINTIQRNADHLLELINDILDLSKIEAKKIDTERIECSPHEIIADVISLLQERAAEKKLSLDVYFDGPIPKTIHNDPGRLRQVLINLIGNAIKFTESGSVKLTTRLLNKPGNEPQLQIDVSDSGIGIAEDKIQKLFQPFTQADNSTTRKFGGTGLGLTISKQLAILLGGDIAISSIAGKGSTFSVTVSVGQLEGVQLIHNSDELSTVKKQEAATNEFVETPLSNCRILLAEDGPDNQRLIGFILKKAGAKVTLADNGQIAYELASSAVKENRPFDVILMDMQMPVLDGYAATQRLRNDEYSGPIIALTAHAMAGDRQKCLDAGCDDYTTKPVNRKKLVEMAVRYSKITEAVSER